MNNQKFSFTVLSEFKDGCITGAFMPMEAGKSIARHLEEQLYGIIRVNFGGDELYQQWDGGKDITGYDHLLIVFGGFIVFVVDEGCNITLIGFCCGDEEGDIMMKDGTQNRYIKQLPQNDFNRMMLEGFELRKRVIKELKEGFDKKIA